MPSVLPLVAIVCPADSVFTEDAALVENRQLEGVATVKTFRVGLNTPIPEEALDAAALLLWHGPLLDGAAIARMKNCRAIVRNGVGFDSVDIAAAAARGIPVCNVPDYG